MENMVQPENENISSENEENEAMNDQITQPEVQLSSTGGIQDSPEEIAAIEIPESDIAGGIPETEDPAALQATEGEPIGESVPDNDVTVPGINGGASESPKDIITDTPFAAGETELELENETAGNVHLEEEIEAVVQATREEIAEDAVIAQAREQLENIVEEQKETVSLEHQEGEFEQLEEPTKEINTEVTEIKSEHIAEEEDLHEDEHHDDEEYHDEEESFEGMSKEQLLHFVQNASNHAEGRNMNKRVQQARAEFNRVIRDERNDALETWKSEGHDEASYIPAEEPLLSDFNSAFKSYKKSRLDYISNLNVQKEQNLIAKKEILENLKTLTDQSENVSSFNDFKKLQEEWRRIGHVPITEAENIWNSYNYYVNKFYEQRSLYSEFKELDSKRNMTAKEDLVAKIEALHDIEDLNESLRLLKQYQDEWKHIGPVPKDQLETIITRYKNAVIYIYEKKEKLSEELQKRREQNYEAKLALIQKIEEIAEFNSTRVQDWINKNQELGQWIENWRSIGNIPLSKGTELKDRFSASIRMFNKNKNEFFRNRKKEKVDNLRKKTELCEKVEALLTEENPSQHKKEVIKLQDEWKKSGPVPMKYSDKLWKRFQAACDAFFAKIISSQTDQEREQHENLKQKNDVIARIETLLTEENIEAPEQQIRAFQEEFNRIGFVPFREKDKIRKRFFTALNKLISKVGGEPGASNEHLSYQLTIESWGQEPGGGMKLENEERKHSRELKRIENEVATLENNIEFFRNSKNAGELRSNMEKQIADLKAKMGELQEKINFIRNSGRR
jgi:hypothetical protein